MKDKDRIVIPTGHEPEEMLETPQFDAEETLLAARPVVPLTEDAIEAGHRARAKAAPAPLTNTRFPMLALIIIAAVSVGLASGLAIGLYQGRQKTTPSTSAQPSPNTTTTADTHFKQKPAQEEIKTQLPSVQTVAETDTDKQNEPTALSQPEGDPMNEEGAETKALPEDSDTPKPEREAAPDKKRSEEKETPPPASTRKKQQQQDMRADNDGNKRQRAARRRAIREQDTYDDVPQRIERAGQELNRIREIFEGARP